MTVEQTSVTLLDGASATVEIIFLQRARPTGWLNITQFARNNVSAAVVQIAQRNFDAVVRLNVSRLERPDNIDAMFRAPSRFEHAVPIATHYQGLRNYSDRFSSSGAVHSGDPDATLQDVFDGLSYAQGGDEKSFERILLVDDTVASGKTVAAMIERLRIAGLRPSCVIFVACFIWLQP